MPSLEEQVKEQVAKMRKEAGEMLELADAIEENTEAGVQGFITDGDELLGFSFPSEEKDALVR